MRVSKYLLPALLACTALSSLAGPSAAFAQGGIEMSITLAPPAMPDYEQPPMPGDGYIWTPGYWQYAAHGYYWVPGTWVEPPMVGLLWTPGYWGWSGGVYLWNAPYWGTHVGYYGGINYGYGYGGDGYAGGRWEGGHFAYNRSVNNFGGNHISGFYSAPVVNHTPFNHVSFNGGNNGVRMQPTAAQVAIGHEPHTQPTPQQVQHTHAAEGNPALQHSTNNGRPPIAATSRPGEFNGQGVVAPRAAAPPAAHAGLPALRPPATGERPAMVPNTPARGEPAPAPAPHPNAAQPQPHGAPQPTRAEPAQAAPHPAAAPQARPAPEHPAPQHAVPPAAHTAPQPVHEEKKTPG